MNSIRARVALMLVASVLCVVFLSTLVMSQMEVDLIEQNNGEAFAQRVSALLPSLTFEGDAAIFHLEHEPVAGEVLRKPTALLREAFRKAGLSVDVTVKQTPEGLRKAAVQLRPGAGWLAWPVPDRTPPRRVWYGLAGWIGLITVGVIGVALIVAYQATKQLKFLETMAESVGSDGILPRIPEEGSAEIKATARALNMMGKA